MSVAILIGRVVLTIVAAGVGLILAGEDWERGKGYRDPARLSMDCAGPVALLWCIWTL